MAPQQKRMRPSTVGSAGVNQKRFQALKSMGGKRPRHPRRAILKRITTGMIKISNPAANMLSIYITALSLSMSILGMVVRAFGKKGDWTSANPPKPGEKAVRKGPVPFFSERS